MKTLCTGNVFLKGSRKMIKRTVKTDGERFFVQEAIEAVRKYRASE